MDTIQYDGQTMTLRQSLFLCWQLWKWLAETGNDYKSQWPHWIHNGGEVQDCNSQCPCCEYTVKKGTRHCTKCPLRGLNLWQDAQNDFDDPCVWNDSLFNAWSTESMCDDADELKHLASMMAHASKFAYDRECNRGGI